jgi:hypothetical protein
MEPRRGIPVKGKNQIGEGTAQLKIFHEEIWHSSPLSDNRLIEKIFFRLRRQPRQLSGMTYKRYVERNCSLAV